MAGKNAAQLARRMNPQGQLAAVRARRPRLHPFKLLARADRRLWANLNFRVPLAAQGFGFHPQPRSATMFRKPQVAVEPRPDGRWAVQTDGTQRADSLHDRKSDAVTRARTRRQQAH